MALEKEYSILASPNQWQQVCNWSNPEKTGRSCEGADFGWLSSKVSRTLLLTLNSNMELPHITIVDIQCLGLHLTFLTFVGLSIFSVCICILVYQTLNVIVSVVYNNSLSRRPGHPHVCTQL